MKRLIFITTSTILFMVFIVPALVALSIRFIPEASQPSLEGTEEVYGKRSLSQEFISQKENLTAVGMTIKNPNLKNRKDVILSLYEDNNLVRTAMLNGQNIEDGAFVKFIFDPIADSRNKKYMLIVSSPSAGADESLPIFFTKNRLSWMGDMIYKEEIIPGVAISFVTFHKPANKWVVIKDVYSSWLGKIF